MTTYQKLQNMDWVLVFLISVLACIGFAILYSVADGNLTPWASNQMVRFFVGFCLMIGIAIIDMGFWYRWSWLFFGLGVVLLLFVELFGSVGMGAQRWIDLRVVKLQPSELMKIASILAVARFFSSTSLQSASSWVNLLIIGIILLIPAGLVYRQPDLGTAILLLAGGVSIVFISGVSWRWFAGGIGFLLAVIPFVWSLVLRPYQKRRVLTFLNPEQDSLGAGYHILQSQIAIGSGGLTGNGFMQGTQANLNFLPEKHTDFIFTVIAEDFGFIGAVAVLFLIMIILVKILFITLNVRSKFAKLVAMGMGTTFFLYIIINVGMIMGLFPVVGVPFPFLSYGGTVIITMMAAFGFIQNIWVHRHANHQY
jgi:rod shape determining protein RodA